MEQASWRIAPVVLVMKQISPKIRLVPMLMRIATPTLSIKSTGSNQEVVVKRRIRKTRGMMMLIIFTMSELAERWASTVSTGDPLMALSGPMISRMAPMVSIWFSSPTTRE